MVIKNHYLRGLWFVRQALALKYYVIYTNAFKRLCTHHRLPGLPYTPWTTRDYRVDSDYTTNRRIIILQWSYPYERPNWELHPCRYETIMHIQKVTNAVVGLDKSKIVYNLLLLFRLNQPYNIFYLNGLQYGRVETFAQIPRYVFRIFFNSRKIYCSFLCRVRGIPRNYYLWYYTVITFLWSIIRLLGCHRNMSAQRTAL